MTFYKILDFKYKGRYFTAFRNDLGFQTFLEYRSENNERKYHYIDEETYKKLYDMFLVKKPSFYDDGKHKGKVFNFIPKVISSAGVALLLASLTACGVPSNVNASDAPQLWPNQIFDKNEVILTEDYEVYEIVRSINLLTTNGVSLYWGEESRVTFDDVRSALAANDNIDEFLSGYIANFLDKLEMKCPNINLACFYHNVCNLNSEAVGDIGMMQACGSFTATACFLADNSTIYYNLDRLDDENFEYIMNHEIGHMLLNANKQVKGYETERHYTTGTNTGFMIEEGLDTLLIEDVIGVSLSDVAYRLPANYDRILMHATGYSFEDYVDGYHLEFERRIKEYLNNPEFNVDNLPYLMEYQKYNIRQNKDIEMEDSEFHDLYEVIAGVYFKDYSEYCTSREEIVALYDNLIDEIIRDVYAKEGKYIFDFTGLVDGLKIALRDNGIDKSLWPNEDDLKTVVIVYAPEETMSHTMG